MRKGPMAIALMLVLICMQYIPMEGGSIPEVPQESPERIWTLVDEEKWDLRILPGQEKRIYLDSSEGNIGRISPGLRVTQKAESALEIVPEWIHDALALKFHHLPPEKADPIAEQILEAEGKRTLDEIAFVAAHLSVETVNNENFFPELMTHNARLIYDHESLVPYARILEKGDHTTIVYNTTQGELELPRDLYYWYVVHPDLGDEVPTYVDPNYDYTEDPQRDRDHGTPPPRGKFWRDWFFVNNKTGQPLLPDLLNTTYTYMDGIRAVNSWISGSMEFTSDEERPNQPVRIYEKGIGRCGEYQDLRTSAGRASLLPIVPTSNSAEDHVWNEFWRGRWIHWDGTYDRPHIYESGWGKTLSTVWNQRGDGFTWDVTDRYTEVSTVNVTVVDVQGKPADGTLVELKTEMFYMEDLKTTTNSATTGPSGQLQFMVGDGRNYWGTADGGDLGKDPLNPNIAPREIVTNSSVGEEYPVRFRLPRAAENSNPIGETEPESDDHRYMAKIDFDVKEHVLRGKNSFTGDTYEKIGPGGDISYMALDSSNDQKYGIGSPFTALLHSERVKSGSVSIPLYDYSPVFFYLTNTYSQATVKDVELNISIYGYSTSSFSMDNTSFETSQKIEIRGTAEFMEDLESVHVMVEGLTDWLEADLEESRPGMYEFSRTLNDQGIPPGNHTVWCRAKGVGDIVHYSSQRIEVHDDTPPEVTITEMPPGPYIVSDTILIRGVVTDHHRVDELYFFVDRDRSTEQPLLLVGEEFELSLELSRPGYGDHRITIEASDPSGNIGARTLEISIGEGEFPRVFLDEPGRGDLIRKGDMVEIGGEAYDNIGVENLYLMLDGRKIADLSSSLNENGFFQFLWDSSEQAISDGFHELEVRAEDPSGNEYGRIITVDIDSEGPEIKLFGPEMGIFGPDQNAIVEGEATDRNGVSSLRWKVGDGPWTSDSSVAGNGDFTLEIEAPDGVVSGEVRITVEATDEAGNTESIYTNIFLDSDGPDIHIDELPQILLRGDEIRLNGSVEDDSGPVEVHVDVDGLGRVEELPGNGEIFLDLKIPTEDMGTGDTTISVTAFDMVGNRNVFRGSVNIVKSSTDTDGDGMPDIWEFRNGLHPYEPDADGDPDGDGYTNLEEYLGNDGYPGNQDHSDPFSKTSYPHRIDEGGNMWPLVIALIAVAFIATILVLLVVRISRKG